MMTGSALRFFCLLAVYVVAFAILGNPGVGALTLGITFTIIFFVVAWIAKPFAAAS